MIPKEVLQTKLYAELENKDIFDLKRQKVLHNLDNIYFSMYLKNDCRDTANININKFIHDLEYHRSILDKYKDNMIQFLNSEFIFSRKSTQYYQYCLSINGACDIFICKNIMTNNTNRIHIQVRSPILWTFLGHEQKALDFVFLEFKKILDFYNIEIDNIKENRLDYAYHTNCIQNTEQFFDTSNLQKIIKTPLTKGILVFDVDNNYFNYNYFSLGKRQSNNVFFRCYHKAFEILDKSHKYYFFDIWKDKGLISEYDYKIYQIATVNYVRDNFYQSIFNSMVIFYDKYGSDSDVKLKFASLKENENICITNKLKFAKTILPFPTVILNFEYQTMRKFYYNGDSFIDGLACIGDNKELIRLYKILQNRTVFLNYLTNNVVNFNSYFWERLQKLKIKSIVSNDKKYKRSWKCKNDVNIALARSKLLKCLALLNLYQNNYDSDLTDDIENAMSLINDNDMLNILEYKKIKDKRKKSFDYAFKELLQNKNNNDK